MTCSALPFISGVSGWSPVMNFSAYTHLRSPRCNRSSNIGIAPNLLVVPIALQDSGFGANIVYDASIEVGDDEFEACAQQQNPPFRRSCVYPVPFVGPDLDGCPGHPPRPPLPTPRQCRQEGCEPRKGGGCICS